ncbi:MAG TPA: glycosyltransferase family 4 protein [Anaerohalosphaeraceae bacterium]|nr:glycosyltransferase family 4 protein [Anaerohalosphaeraceae bacterium]
MSIARRFRILHVIDRLEGGGAQRQLKYLIDCSDTEQFAHGILFLAGDTDVPFFNRPVDCLRVDRGRKWELFSFGKRVYEAVMDYRPDLLHVWLPEVITIPAALAGRRLNIPIVSGQRRSLRGMPGLKGKFRDRLALIQHGLSHQIITNFPVLSEPLFFRFLYRRKKGFTIPNGIRLCRTQSSVPFPNFKKNNTFLLWYTGRIVPQKRAELLLEAFCVLRGEGLNLSLVVCGTDQMGLQQKWKDRLKKARLEEDVHFTGYRPDWHGGLEQADLFVLPSVSEGMPNVLFEAMLAGCCAAASAIPVIRYYLEHKKHAWLFAPDSLTSLKEAVRTLYSDETLRKRLANEGQKQASLFSLEKMTRSYEEAYRRLLKQ